jgi:periplasmic divalent cation tolerance protein
LVIAANNGGGKERKNMTNFIQVLTAIGSKDDAQKIAASAVGKRLAACAQVIGPITSTYWWQGAIETAEEWLCLLKTREDLYTDLEQDIRANHPYDVPEIVAMPVVAGNASYLAWILGETQKTG